MDDKVRIMGFQIDGGADALIKKFKSGARIGGVFDVICRRPDGSIRWHEKAHNIITNVGLDHILDVVLHGATPTSPWYAGIKNAGAVAAGDTSASHAGWVENENYDQATRVEYVEAAASGQSITNSASPATFTIDTDSQSIAGAFLIAESTKGGSTGVLLCAADFASAKSCDDDDTLDVTYTISAADDGA